MKLMKKYLSNQRGVTLIELLAVIVILGILAAVAVPVVLNQIDDAGTKADEATETIVIDAAQRYFIKNSNITTVTIEELKDAGYLKEVPANYSNKSVKYSKTNNVYSIEIIETTTPTS